ncbi:hypothetical protein [Phenylobacterium aquaticum]|uniref:hypothetical protein n=1 Tax=Phenylobacterium aquaticum TaxID=1763816 RepID=UPI0026EABEF0|nr:hypothetical protein [Phenylobacterium aquaticum]
MAVQIGPDDAKRRTQRLVYRCISELLIDEAGRLVAAHERDFIRAIIHLAVAQASRGGSDEGQRAISVRAIAQSLGLPYETTRRKVLELEEQGYCRRVSAQRVAATDLSIYEAGRGPTALETVVAAIADLKTLGFSLDQIMPAAGAREPSSTPPGEGTVRNLLDDFILRILESGVGAHGSMLDAVVFVALMNANAEPITHDPTMAWRYSGAETPPPDSLRRPATIAELAQRLSIPRETMRRRISHLIKLDRCMAVPGGYMTRVEFMQAPAVLEGGASVVHHFGQLLGHLRHEGLDLNAIPPRVTAEGAAA